VTDGTTTGAARPRARERGRMRRRLRSQRRMREALLLDLGALVYELHRQGRREPELLQAKAAELSAVDDEVRALADALEEDESVLELVAAGIAGSCEGCGSLLSTDSRYCPTCGRAALAELDRPGAVPEAPAPPQTQELEPVAEPEPDREPEPDAEAEPEAEAEAQSEPAPPVPPPPAAPWLAGRDEDQ
jgi:hypothetical protein